MHPVERSRPRMCGRFTQPLYLEEVAELYELNQTPKSIRFPSYDKGASVNVVRAIAILIGVAVMVGSGYGLGAPSYVSIPAGVVGYLVTRYGLWAVQKCQRKPPS